MAKSFHFTDDTRASASGFAVAPNDVSNLPELTRAVYIGGDGNLAVLLEWDTSSITLVGLKAGTLLPIRAIKILSTGTTATNIVGLV